MILKNVLGFKWYYSLVLISVVLLSCEDDIREVALYEKGLVEFTTTDTSIGVDGIVSFQNTSTKVQSLTWTFDGGNPSSSFNSNVDVVYSTSGVYEATLEIKHIDNQIEKKTVFIEVSPLAIVPQAPFEGSANLTDTRIEFEDFDEGGEGISYHDSDSENVGDSNYRFGHGVDIINTSDEEGDHDINTINDGEWLEYTVFVDNESVYDFNFRLLSTSDTSTIEIQEIDGDNTTIIGKTAIIPNSGGAYSIVTAENIALTAGQHVLRMYFTGGGIQANYFEIENTVFIAPVDRFGIYTENTTVVEFTTIQLQVNNQFAINTINDNTYEGDNALSFTIDGSAPWAMASIIADTPVDISNYLTYNFAIRSTSVGNILIRLQGGGQRGIITLKAVDESYGFIRDGNWHLITIPLSDFIDNNPALDLTSISDLMVLRSDDAQNVSALNNYDFYLDNFYLSK